MKVWWLAFFLIVGGWRGVCVWAVGMVVVRLRQGRHAGEETVDRLLVVLAVAVRAGASVGTALEHAVFHVDSALADSITTVLRRSRTIGLAAALATAEGPLGPVAGALARVQISGASVAATLDNLLTERRSRARSEAIHAARTLPVKLVVPVSLLLLPGFLALVVFPPIIEQLTGFGALTP